MICNPKGIRTKRHHVFFGLVEDSIPPLLTSDHVTIPIFGIPSTVAQSKGFVTIRARHPEMSIQCYFEEGAVQLFPFSEARKFVRTFVGTLIRPLYSVLEYRCSRNSTAVSDGVGRLRAGQLVAAMDWWCVWVHIVDREGVAGRHSIPTLVVGTLKSVKHRRYC